MKPTPWTCDYCGHPQVVTDDNWTDYTNTLEHTEISELGAARIRVQGIVCLNPKCKKLSLDVWLHERVVRDRGVASGKQLHHWGLLPESTAKPQPDYIPKAIREDYSEACRIRELSPKSSAALARRCLQGMIRDFCKIQKNRLIDEIKELRARVDNGTSPQGVTHESVDAIDHVRSIGNIGAHMEKDVDLIIEIEPGEAQALIELIEMLLVEWYVERKQRQDRLAKVALIGAQKEQKRADAKVPRTSNDNRAAEPTGIIPEIPDEPGTT
jgi:hypothetical protein